MCQKFPALCEKENITLLTEEKGLLKEGQGRKYELEKFSTPPQKTQKNLLLLEALAAKNVLEGPEGKATQRKESEPNPIHSTPARNPIKATSIAIFETDCAFPKLFFAAIAKL